MYNKRKDRDPELSRVYKSLVRLTELYNRVGISYKLIRKYFKGTGRKVTPNTTNIARDYIDYIIQNGLDDPDGVYIHKLGKISIYEYDSVNGKPRVVPDGNGGYKEAVETIFDKTTKYRYQFVPNYAKIKPTLRFVVHGYYSKFAASKILPKVYELHPKGNFYPLRKPKD